MGPETHYFLSVARFRQLCYLKLEATLTLHQMLKLPSVSKETSPTRRRIDTQMVDISRRISNCLVTLCNAVTNTPDILHWNYVHKGFQIAPHHKVK